MNTTKPAVFNLAIVVLALATAAIHASRALADAKIAPLFWLNAIGYVVLTAALLAPAFARWQRLARWALIVYTAITIAFYLLWGLMSGEWLAPLGPLDKVIELALIAVLVLQGRAEDQLKISPA